MLIFIFIPAVADGIYICPIWCVRLVCTLQECVHGWQLWIPFTRIVRTLDPIKSTYKSRLVGQLNKYTCDVATEKSSFYLRRGDKIATYHLNTVVYTDLIKLMFGVFESYCHWNWIRPCRLFVPLLWNGIQNLTHGRNMFISWSSVAFNVRLPGTYPRTKSFHWNT